MQNFGGQINGRCARGVFKNTADTPTKVIGFILNDTDVIYGEAGYVDENEFMITIAGASVEERD